MKHFILFFLSSYSQINFQEHIVTDNSNFLNRPQTVISADVDGDLDVISASYEGAGKIGWFENIDGSNISENLNIISTEMEEIIQLFAADIDNDGDMDLFSVSQYDGTIAWYEHSPILGVNANNQLDFTLYPNPTSGKLTINSNQTINNIEVYNQLGQLIVSVPNKNEIDVSFLNSGMYFIKISDKKGNLTVKKVIKK